MYQKSQDWYLCANLFFYGTFFYHSFLFFSLNLYTHPRKWGTYPRNVGTYPRNVGTYPRNVGTYPSKCWYISLEMLVHMSPKHPDFIGFPRPLKVFKKKY